MRVLCLPDKSRWYNAHDLVGNGYFTRVAPNQSLWYNLPRNCFFKRHLGELLKGAGSSIAEASGASGAASGLHANDVMLSTFGVMYLAIKMGGKGNTDLTPLQCSVLRHVVPELASQPSYCSVPGATSREPSATHQQPNTSASAAAGDDYCDMWFDVDRFFRDVHGINYWFAPASALQAALSAHLAPEGKALLRDSTMLPVCAAEHAQACLVSALNARSMSVFGYCCACGNSTADVEVKRVMRQQHQKLEMEINRVVRRCQQAGGAKALAMNIARSWL